MAILLNNHGYDNQQWLTALATALPDDNVVLFTDDYDPDDIEFALVWNHPNDDLLRYPNLRGILLLGAGTEHIDQAEQLPHVPIVRLIDPAVVQDMAMFSLYWVLHYHRHFEVYRQQQRQSTWVRHATQAAEHFPVTVLGLGQIGEQVAKRLAANGFACRGWDAFPKTLDGIVTADGTAGLAELLADSQVVINCLPLTEQTEGLINGEFLQHLPPTAVLVNISRGAIINEADLLSALDNNVLQAAVLDAHRIEPLPSSSPLWKHPKIHITPHASGATYARSAVHVVAANIAAIRAGKSPSPQHYPPCLRQTQTAKTENTLNLSVN